MITTGDKIPATSLAELPTLFPNARFFNIYGCTETNDSLMHEFLGLADGNVPSNMPVGQPLPGVTARVQNEQGRRSRARAPASCSSGRRSRRAATSRRRSTRRSSCRSPTTAGGRSTAPATSSAATTTARSRSRVAPTSTSRSAACASARRSSSRRSRSTPRSSRSGSSRSRTSSPASRLHAVVRREPDSKLNSLKLRQHCATRLARTEMPSTIEIVTEPLPKTSTGKIDRKKITAELERSRANG